MEERNLLKAHPEYAEYRYRVPMLIPRIFGRRSAALGDAQSETV